MTNKKAITASRDLIEELKMKYNNQPIEINKNSTINTLNIPTDIFLHKVEAKKSTHKPKR